MKTVSRIFVVSLLILIGFSSCEQKEKPKDSLDNSVTFFNDSIFQSIKKIVPNNWTITNDSAFTLVLMTKDSLQLCNFTNTDEAGEENYNEYVKDKIVDKRRFQIRFTFRNKLTEKQIQKINEANENIDKEVSALLVKYHIDQLSRKFDDFIPHTKTDSLNIISYKKERDEIIKRRISTPDFTTKKNSIYISNNLPFPTISLCYPNQEQEVEELIYKIEDVLKGEK